MINLINSIWLKGLRKEIFEDLLYEAMLWLGLINLWLIRGI